MFEVINDYFVNPFSRTQILAISFTTTTSRARALARTIWNDASANCIFDCTWHDDEPCVQHATLMGGSVKAYNAYDDAMIREFEDRRLDQRIAEYIMFNSKANIPVEDCTSLLSYSAERKGAFGDRGAAVAAARKKFLKKSPV